MQAASTHSATLQRKRGIPTQFSALFLTTVPNAKREALARDDAKIREVLDSSSRHLGRKELAVRMSEEVGHTISVHMLNAWMAPGRELARFPVVYVEAFCRATSDDTLRRLVLGPQLCQLLELGERAAAILDERARRRVLKIPKDVPIFNEKRNGNGSCVR